MTQHGSFQSPPLRLPRLLLRVLVLLLLLLVLLAAASSSSTATVKCPVGWGRGDKTVVTIPAERINDGYCDCPTTGADEPATDACAGHWNWPGVVVVQPPQPEAILYFDCPQQSKLRLPLSRVQDGICDCCDGADERMDPTTVVATTTTTISRVVVDCPDVCDELLQHERAEAARRIAHFTTGATQRAQAEQEFRTVQDRTRFELQKVKADLFMNQQQVGHVESLLHTVRLAVLEDRLTTVVQRTLAVATTFPTAAALDLLREDQRGLLLALTSRELVWLIVHACQLAGEVVGDDGSSSSSDSSSKTCVPLRLAALDRAQWWESGTYQFIRISEEDDDARSHLANVLEHNLKPGSRKKWFLPTGSNDKPDAAGKKKPHHGRRRLEEDVYTSDDEVEEDDYRGLHDDMYRAEDSDDDELHEEEDQEPEAVESNESSNGDSDSTRRDELYKLISSQPFSESRVAFLVRSNQILELIAELTKKEERKNDGDEEESSNATKADEDAQPETDTSMPFDPMALPMIKNQLERRKKNIERGFDYAISAHVLLDSFKSAVGEEDEETLRHFLYPLVLGTLNHGNLSLFHFWQILSKTLPELLSEEASSQQQQQTCRSFLSEYCPPRAIVRDSITVPPTGIVQVLDEWCNAQIMVASSSDVAGTCVAELDDAPQVSIPPDVPDGFAGYFDVHARDQSDFFHVVFGDIGLHDTKIEGLAELTELEEELRKLEHEQKDLEKSIKEMTELLGGEDGNAFGPDGELYALKDTCHTVEAAKYTYEVCLFGAASQKESGQTGRGTDLGKWTGFSIDKETGGRVWKWENGAKCWNGPKRSATVHVTCGQDNKVLSAEEPETCRYVLEMESYIACDEDYRRRHDLPDPNNQ